MRVTKCQYCLAKSQHFKALTKYFSLFCSRGNQTFLQSRKSSPASSTTVLASMGTEISVVAALVYAPLLLMLHKITPKRIHVEHLQGRKSKGKRERTGAFPIYLLGGPNSHRRKPMKVLWPCREQKEWPGKFLRALALD